MGELLASLMLVPAVGVAGLSSPDWESRAAAHRLLCDVSPLSAPFAAAGSASADPETAYRCGQVVEGKGPRVMPVPAKWEPWPKNRLR